MGCDVHLFVEHKIDGVWNRIESQSLEAAEDRNYVLFGALAGVRYHLIPQCHKLKEIPKDLSHVVGEAYHEWSGDAHSVSHLSLTELLIIRDTITVEGPNISLASYKKYKNGLPGYLTSEGFYMTEYISNEEMDRLIALSSFIEEDKYHTKIVNRKFPYRKTSEVFWVNLVDDMAKLDSNTDNVRVVFWFDN